MVAIDKMVEQKAKEMIEKEAKKENNDPKVEKKSRFSYLAERQECWNDEFQVMVIFYVAKNATTTTTTVGFTLIFSRFFYGDESL